MTSGMSKDRFLVDEMIRHLTVVDAVSKDGREAVTRDPTHRYALEHACELLSEAAKHTSNVFKTLNPELSWASLRQLRNAVAHPYDQDVSAVQLTRLWEFVINDAPKLSAQLRKVRFARTA